MMTDEKMLATYETLVQLGHVMLEAVQRGDWDAFAEQETRQAALVDMLRREDTEQSTDPLVLAQKKAMIEVILGLQNQIVEPVVLWRSAVSNLMASVSTNRRVAAAYGSDSQQAE